MSVFTINEEPKKKKVQKPDNQTVRNYLIQECLKHTVYSESWLNKQNIKSLRWLANRHLAQLKQEVQS